LLHGTRCAAAPGFADGPDFSWDAIAIQIIDEIKTKLYQ